MTVDVYVTSGSPPCGAVRLLAKYLGLDVNVKQVNLREKEHLTPEYLKINPFHKVPTIVDDGFVVYESNAILYYFVNKYAPDSPLHPKCPKGRANVDKVLAAVTSTIQPHYFAFFRPRFYDKKRSTAEEVGAFEQNVLSGFQNLIGDGRYAVGDSLTLADFSLVAHLSTALELPHYQRGKFPKLETYYERLKKELPGFEEIFRAALEARKKLWETELH